MSRPKLDFLPISMRDVRATRIITSSCGVRFCVATDNYTEVMTPLFGFLDTIDEFVPFWRYGLGEDHIGLSRRTVNPAGEDRVVRLGAALITHGDAWKAYEHWLPPACIIADGPYGLGKFPGEPKSPDTLAEWYAPHAAAWARYAQPFTTVWFWNSEIEWAKAHPALELHGWQYEETVIWDKGIGHVAGNCNSKTIRGVPVVTELAVRYTRRLC